MDDIKERRLKELCLDSHPGLFVGHCVPFYFCPRSVMLYVISRANHPKLSYRAGQTRVVHLEADLRSTVVWAEEQNLRWAFTLSNAGARYFEDRSDLGQLDEIDWTAVEARDWRDCGGKAGGVPDRAAIPVGVDFAYWRLLAGRVSSSRTSPPRCRAQASR